MGRTAIVGVTAFVLNAAVSSFASWPFETNGFIFVSPSIADINGDGSLEIVFGSWDGHTYCTDIAGNQLWSTLITGEGAFPAQIHSSPTLIDIDNTPASKEIIFCAGGKLVCLSNEGKILVQHQAPQQAEPAPLVADLDHDGKIEVLFRSTAALTCVNLLSTPLGWSVNHRWSIYDLGNSYLGAPVAADVNADGNLEVIFTAFVGPSKFSSPSVVRCVDANGEFIWSYSDARYITGNTPAVADLDNDGSLEVVVACFSGPLLCLNGSDGAIEWEFGPGFQSQNSPAISDLNNDGLLEVIYAPWTIPSWKLICVDHAGKEVWQHVFSERAEYSSAAIADIDGDSDLEIAIGTSKTDSSPPARLFLFDALGNVIANPIMPATIYSAPSMADLDGDGFLEVAFGCYDDKFYVLDHLGNTFVPSAKAKPGDSAPWPTYRQNNQRTGLYPVPNSPDLPGDITGNGIVDVDDLLAAINAWGACVNPNECPSDIAPDSGNDVVDVDDLLMVINNWS